MGALATDVVVDLYSHGWRSDDPQTLLVRLPNGRSDLTPLDLVTHLNGVGINTFEQDQPPNDYFLIRPIRGAAVDEVFDVVDVLRFSLIAVASGVLGNSAYDALKRLARSLTSGAMEEPKPLTDAEASVWGLAMISRRYSLSTELRLLSVTLAEPNATVRAEGSDGTIYTADLEVIDGLAALGRSTREVPARGLDPAAGRRPTHHSLGPPPADSEGVS